jgi:hypothetical protein
VGESFVSYGVRIGIRSTQPEGIACLMQGAPPVRRHSPAEIVDRLYSIVWGGSGPRRGVTRLHVLYSHSRRLVRTTEIAKVQAAFERDVTLFIGTRAPRHVFVHAGVVGVGDGAVVFPGTSFAGKTTLTRALLELGARYVSDDFAVLDNEGRVVPWPRDLGIRERGARRGAPGQRVAPAELGIVPERRPLPMKLLVLTQYQEGSRFRPRLASPAEGALGMLSNTVPARARPEASLRSITRAVQGAIAVSSPRGEADEAARAILKLATKR